MKKITFVSSFSTLLALALIVPQVALAAWWNPFSWNWFAFFTQPHPVQITATTTTSIQIGNSDNVPISNTQSTSTEKKVVPKTTTKADVTPVSGGPSQQQTDVAVKAQQAKSAADAAAQAQQQLLLQQQAEADATAKTQEALYQQQIQQAQAQAQQQKQDQINSITQNCNTQMSQLNQQIIDLKNIYYKRLPGILSSGTSVVAQGNANLLLDQTNQKIAQLDLQIQQIQLDCQNQINAL